MEVLQWSLLGVGSSEMKRYEIIRLVMGRFACSGSQVMEVVEIVCSKTLGNDCIDGLAIGLGITKEGKN